MNITNQSESHHEASAGKSVPLYPISIASKLTNTTVYTLRVYEDRGLIIPYRTNTGRRLYSDTDIARLHQGQTRLEYGVRVQAAQYASLSVRPEEFIGDAVPVCH